MGKIIRIILLIGCGAILFPSALQAQKKKTAMESKSQDARFREAEFFFTEAEKFFILEDYAKALLYFQRAADLNPTNSAIHYKIAEILSRGTQEEELEKAAQSIEQALKYEQKNKYIYLLASNIYSSLSKFDKAAQVLETMFKEVKDADEYLYELAAMYLYNKKADEALATYNRAEQVLGINEVSSIQKQRILLEKGKVNEAIKEGEKLIEAFPDEERYVLGLAETMGQFGQTAKAIEFLENYSNQHPASGNAKMLLAGLYREAGQEQKSREFVKQVFDDSSVEVNRKILMLSIYTTTLNNNQTKKIEDEALKNFTIDLYKQLESNYPNDVNVQLIGGDLFFSLEQDAEAKKHYLMAVRGGTGSFEAWQNLMYLESENNEFDSLISHAEQALEIFPNQAMAHYFQGYGLLRKKKYKEGAYALEQAKKLSTKNPGFISDLNSMLGDAYNGAKDYVKSDAAYEEALAFNPNNDFVLNNYSYYLALRKENLEKAEKMSGQLIKLHPDNVAYLDTHAWVLFAREKYKEARKMMEKAIQIAKPSPTHLEHYGDILYKLGDIDQAVIQWQKAKQLDGDNAALEKKITNRKIN